MGCASDGSDEDDHEMVTDGTGDRVDDVGSSEIDEVDLG